jgi:hypothetical protein
VVLDGWSANRKPASRAFAAAGAPEYRDGPEEDFWGVSRFHLSGHRVNQDLAADRVLILPASLARRALQPGSVIHLKRSWRSAYESDGARTIRTAACAAIRGGRKPIPKNGEVLVKLCAASVNPVDLYCMRGAPLIRLLSTPKQKVLGCDIAGRVERLAETYISFSRATRCLGYRA